MYKIKKQVLLLAFVSSLLIAAVWLIMSKRREATTETGEAGKVNTSSRVKAPNSPDAFVAIRKKARTADQANEKQWEKNPIQKLVEIRTKERPRFRLMDDEGFVTSQAIETHGLNDIQTSELKSATAVMRSAIREQLVKNIVKDEERSKPGSAAYRIKPFSEESNKIIAKFVEDVSKSVGDSIAWDLAKAIPVEQNAGGYGLYEVILSVNEPAAEQVVGMNENDVKKLNSIVYEYRDAETGKEVREGVSSMSAFNAKFFDLFE
jgi:hypothetical protein